MSVIRSCLIISAAIMLLPVEEHRQAEFTATASSTAERTAGYCERNPSTCQAGRELWANFVRKAEYGAELGSKIIREQVLRTVLQPQQQPPATTVQALPPARLQPAAAPPEHTHMPARRLGYAIDNASRSR